MSPEGRMLVNRAQLTKLICTNVGVNMEPANVSSLLLTDDEPDYVLFKVAIEAAERGANVWFISTEPFVAIPDNIEQPEKHVLRLITFIYLKTLDDLVEHLDGTHAWYKPPSLIILKDAHSYCGLAEDRCDVFKAAMLATVLIDSAACCASKRSTKCRVLVTCWGCVDDSLQVLYDMYFSEVLVKREFDDDESLLVKVRDFLSRK
ncbi:uncharacterized protein LOC132707871 [Cylas formicarius]|uniref:uncharacterized protein LOC132707871 n=1 Tax=Cylas formicarius TaxID=197179 RepID=UPI002958A79E|nr:uncharacterized protein LOC132707871 [Cylas formicarius]